MRILISLVFFLFSCGNEMQTNPCASKVCETGVCSLGECVNPSQCSENEECLSDFACFANRCHNEAEICTALNCSEACDYQNLRCEENPKCMDDVACQVGWFCTSEKECQANVCDPQTGKCDRGICGLNGDCIDSETCDSTLDCLGSRYCIGEKCTPIEEACQTCQSDEQCTSIENRVVCESTNGCKTRLDCVDPLVCSNGLCVEPVSCADDPYEPNDAEQSATSWTLESLGGSLSGSICQNDVDVFKFDTRGTKRKLGVMLVQVQVDLEDSSNGNLHLELKDQNGSTVATQTQIQGTTIEMRYDISGSKQGVYSIHISGTDIHLTGIKFQLFVDIVDIDSDVACQNARKLVGTMTGNIANAPSSELDPGCGSNPDRKESIFTFTVDEKSWVEFDIDADFLMITNIRSACQFEASSVSCRQPTYNYIPYYSSFSRVLEPGTYFIVLQAADWETYEGDFVEGIDGPFEITIRQTPIKCEPHTSRCTADDTYQSCSFSGQTWNEFSCKGTQCDMESGFCTSVPGDVCENAIDASNSYFEYDMVFTNSDYESETCGYMTEEPEVVYFIDLPPRHRVDATALLWGRQFTDISFNYVRDCYDIEETCLEVEGGNFPEEGTSAGYANRSAKTERIYLIAKGDSNSISMQIETTPLVCVPDSHLCSGDDLIICNSLGNEKNTFKCIQGCDSEINYCNPGKNDTCATAHDAGNGGAYSGFFSDYTHDYPRLANECSTPGPDGVWFVDATQGQLLTVDVDSEIGVSIYILTDCDVCPEAISLEDGYLIPQTGTYYIFVDHVSATGTAHGSNGEFALDIKLQDIICVEGDTICNGTDLQFCNEKGTGFDTFPCPIGCDATVDQCIGDTCESPLMTITASGQYLGDTTPFRNAYDPDVGEGCFAGTATDRDVAFAIEGTPGTIVEVSATGELVALIAMGDCKDRTTCIDADLNYRDIFVEIPANGTAFLIVDKPDRYFGGMFVLDVRFP